MSTDGAVSLTVSDDVLRANATQAPGALSGVADLARQLLSHGIAEVAFDAGAGAAGLLGSARILTGEAAAGDGGASATSKLQALGAPGVRFVGQPVSPPAAAPAAPLAVPASPPAVPAPTPAPSPATTAPGALPDFGLGELDVLDEQAMHATIVPTP